MDNGRKIKVTAVYKELDCAGNVVVRKRTVYIPDIIDRKAMLSQAIVSCDYSGFRPPFGDYHKMMMKYFGANSEDAADRAHTVETERVGGLKFVFKRGFGNNGILMKWENA